MRQYLFYNETITICFVVWLNFTRKNVKTIERSFTELKLKTTIWLSMLIHIRPTEIHEKKKMKNKNRNDRCDFENKRIDNQY